MNDQGIKVFWLGAFLIGALGMVAWLLLLLRPSYGDGREELRIRFTNVEKVDIGTRVTYAGKAVGKVVAINEIYNARDLPTNKAGDYYFYELVLRVDSSVKVYSSDQVLFTTTGLFGEKSIAILPKPPPPGEHAVEVTGDVLYAKSSEGLEEALTHFAEIKDTLCRTLDHFDQFIVDNHKEFHQTLLSVTKAADEMNRFLTSAEQNQLLQKASDAFTSLSTMSNRVTTGEGTLGRLMDSDELYCNLLYIISDIRCLISDINNYGLLFQYNRKWQRTRLLRQCGEY